MSDKNNSISKNDVYLDFDYRDNFKDHVVTVVENTPNVQIFSCRKPDTSIYSFSVTFTSDGISMFGDIGSLMLRQGIDWFRHSIRDCHYAMSKIPHEFSLKEFDSDTAKKHMEEMISEDVIEYELLDDCKGIIEDLNDGSIESASVFVSRWFSGGFGGYEHPEISIYKRQVWYQMSAFVWLAEQLDKMDFKKASNE